MYFRNLTMLRFPKALDLSDLDAGLAEAALRPVGPLELSSRGFVPPFGRDFEPLSHRIGDAIWLTVGGEDRLLPGDVVNDELAKRIASIEEQEGRRPGGRRRKQLKEDVVHELLPKAFVRPSRVDAMLDLERGVIAVNTSSRRVAEGVASEIRRALGSFPALPLNAEVSPRGVLTGWLAGEPLPGPPGFMCMGEGARLQDAADGGGVVTIDGLDLGGEEVTQHLEAGKQCTRLALVLDDHVSFVLGEDLVLRKFRLLDGAIDQLAETEADDVATELDARFALMAGEFGRLFDVLERALHISSPEA